MTTLLDIWIGQRDFLEAKSVEQIIAIAGDGNLRDNNETSVQLRELFSNLPSANIGRYIDECLSHSFPQSGLILQDLVNEVGRRLGFSVESGYYRGGGTKIGFDGIWRAKDEYAFVIEVKTTDAYQLNLDIQAKYRERLIDEKRISEKDSSILVVVGRKDTGGLEAQTRGSRHAWDIRLISIAALLKLMRVKERLSDTATVSQIQEILKPLEYTRVDRLIDIIFSTSEDLQSEEIENDVTVSGTDDSFEAQLEPVKFHVTIVERVSSQLGLPLIQQGRCTYINADQTWRLLCIVSKEYQKSGITRYWYAFRPNQQEFLNEGRQSYIAFGCGSEAEVILIPSDVFQQYLPKMRMTSSGGRFYWHVEIFKKGDKYLLNKANHEGVDITTYLMK